MPASVYTTRIPAPIRWLYRRSLWRVKTPNPEIFLTFDDGPSPGVTEGVLDTLKSFDAKATFFCIGDKIDKAPELLLRIREEGHSLGHHSHNHLNGWKTSKKEYLANVEQGAEAMAKVLGEKPALFRPPYGRMSLSQYKELASQYRIIMWDLVTGDWDHQRSKEKVLEIGKKYSRPGSIIVFHDSPKAKDRMEYALPRLLESLSKQGYTFSALNAGY